MLPTATPAHAQATDPANAGEGGAAADEIVVTGLRASLENAAAIKRDSGQIQDSIVAEDIGKLPDTNIAETLQRIPGVQISRSEEHTSELQSLMRISYAVFCLKKKKKTNTQHRSQ